MGLHEDIFNMTRPSRRVAGFDANGNWVETLVDNVLISPSSTEDITSQMNLTGRKAEYTLAIPKGDLHDWEDKEVLFFGKRWKTFGIPLEGIEEMLPLTWNKKVMVERYE